MHELLLKRAGVFAAVAALVLMLAGCGGGDTVSPTGTTGGGTGAGSTPAAEATSGGGGAVPAGSTPVSDWKAGTHANTVKAPDKLTAPGTLTFGSDVAYPPQEYVGSDGKPYGMDIDIAEEIASRMGLKVNVVNFKFDDIIPALNAGQFDAVISAMTVTEDRQKVVQFVPYFEAGQSVLVKKGNPKGIKTLDDLSGKTAAAQSGTTAQTTLDDLNKKLESGGKPKVNVLLYPVDTDAVDQLRVGRADATVHDSPVAAYYTKLNPDFEIGVENFESAPEGIAVAKDNQAMFDAINSAMDAMKKDGTLDAIKAKWGVK
ncbi:MAG: polar amino acid transport system substrate-binding protein [Chloroflexia bacterium]|nr:polar amino acid transport system substrate-binding protein [Chloroflexia bacterium]